MNTHSRCRCVVVLLALSLGVAPRLPAQGFAMPVVADSAALARETVDLAYRGDADTIIAGGGIRDSAVNSYESLGLVSDPIVARRRSPASTRAISSS